MSNGWLRADALIARTGIQEYRWADGAVRRELRIPEEVFDEAALASFAMVPVVDDHPAEGLLNAENCGKYQRGALGENVRQDGDHVRVNVLITDAALVAKVMAGKTQLSCGYVCDLDETPGTWNGQPFDARQVAIRGNHVAVVDRARGGPGLRLRLDSTDAVSIREEMEPQDRSGDHGMGFKLKVDGIDVEFATEQGVQIVERALKVRADAAQECPKCGANLECPKCGKVKGDSDALLLQVKTDGEAAVAQAKKDGEAFRARATVAEAKNAELEKGRKDATDSLPNLVKARVSLEAKARAILGAEAKIDELTDRKIKETVVTQLLPDLKLDGEPDAYVEAVYRGALAAHEKSATSAGLAAARRLGGAPPGHQDADQHLDAEEIRKKNATASESAWKTPTVGAKA
jgi:uncharacterized protein